MKVYKFILDTVINASYKHFKNVDSLRCVDY